MSIEFDFGFEVGRLRTAGFEVGRLRTAGVQQLLNLIRLQYLTEKDLHLDHI